MHFMLLLTPDLCSEGNFNLFKTGGLSLNLKFGKVREDTIEVIIYTESDKVIEINKHRKVIIN
jgi:phosphopentomutase